MPEYVQCFFEVLILSVISFPHTSMRLNLSLIYVSFMCVCVYVLYKAVVSAIDFSAL